MFDPLHKWLGIPSNEQPPHHYRLLGIAVFEEDTDVIDAAADKQLAFLHDLTNGEYGELAEQLSNQVSAARLCLLNEEKRAAYDEALRGQLGRAGAAVTQPPDIQISIEPALDVSRRPHADRSPASPKDRPRRSQSPRRSQTAGQRYAIFSTLLCIVVLVIVGIGIKQGRLKLDTSLLWSTDAADSATPQPEPTATSEPDAQQPTGTLLHPPQTQPQGQPNNLASGSQTLRSEPSPPKQASPGPTSAAEPKRSLADLVHSSASAEDSSLIVKSPLPSESQLEEKRRLIRELYESEYRNADTSAEKIELAKLMHREGQQTSDDPVGRFALWQVARDIFIRCGEIRSALGIVDNWNSHYSDVHSNLLKVETLRDSVAHVADSGVNEFMDASVSVLADCREAEDFEIARLLCALVNRELTSRVTISKRSEFESYEAEIERVEASHQRYKNALQILEKSAEDARASQEVGRYLCFVRGEWGAGLDYLRRGADPAVRRAAQLELTAESEASQRSTLADAWYDIAESETGSIEQTTILRHALEWYRKAQKDAEGLELRKVDARIAGLERRLPASAIDTESPGDSAPSRLLGYRVKTSSDSRSDFANRKGNQFSIGMGPRPDGLGEAQAGIELQGVEKLSIVGSASHQDMPRVDTYTKTGFVIDYHTPGGYSKRIFLGLGLHPGRQFTEAPLWGAAKRPDVTTDLGRKNSYEIELMRWAPSTWDGRIWFTIYMQNAGPNRALNATVSW